MHLKRVILRDYVRVGSKNTQQINRSDFSRLEMVDGWLHVHHEAGVTMISPASIIQVDLEPVAAEPLVVVVDTESVESLPVAEKRSPRGERPKKAA